jgi:GrpB-like predicted nucleotidyltransferase (UPF0157 family)
MASNAGGLERHPSLGERFDPAIRIVEYDPRRAIQAQDELGGLTEALARLAVRVEHVGSTAVPGRAAKPILDLQVSVAAIEPRARYVEPLERLGYLFVPDPESPDFHFFAKPAKRPRTHHVHVCEAESDHELRHLAFRDFLRAHPGEAAKYAALKRGVAMRHPQDRLAYIGGKGKSPRLYRRQGEVHEGPRSTSHAMGRQGDRVSGCGRSYSSM